ncbi:lipopolysaccharide export system permease protein [Altererythrobacter atlanticus]|uniref:Lipopolysaccharide export system permease protein LptG n=1 Tax=Croceibacterium atlanticum TaxID=1267766 RepID=A0A0F7KV01_9SPHN|nr:LPS export ABC transporter permease LptG [Croceibacterium atlanticum]AKH42595.1 Lipopolysaccharide export system permease protein LptG [Croceibacterium atlanticum]MBB5731372.1 lipopolysaccharide export system permease protein [Croceibacterium atlanticum]
MVLDFFPSATLTKYLAKTFILRILAVLVMLVLVLLMLDLLSNSADILAYQGNGQGELLTYASLRIPQLIARFLPYSILLATIITLATMNQNSEVIAMKASGLSAHQILAPLLLTAMVIAGFSFLFNERVVTRATATLSAWEKAEYGPVPDDPDTRTTVYLADGNDVLLASTVRGRGADTVMEDVTFYQRDDNGMMLRQWRGSRATYANPGWMLEDPEVFNVGPAEERALDEPTLIAPELGLDQLELRTVNPDAESLPQLSRSIEALEAAGRQTSELRGRWWHKISGPLSAVLMPLLGAVAGFGLARSGHLFARAVIGMALGFAYFVVDNAALAMGSFGGYPPLLAAWAPFLLFFLIGETVLVRTEE